VLISINVHTEFEVLSFTHSKYMMQPENFKTGHVTMTTPLSGIPVILKLGLAMVNLQHHSIEHMYTSSLLAFHCYYVPMLHRF